MRFLAKICKACDIPLIVLTKDLYADFMDKFGVARVVAIPFWSITPDGKKAKMRRHCTLDYKIPVIQKYVKYDMLHYPRRPSKELNGSVAMHIGFSAEEKSRVFESMNRLYVNKYPLVEMGLTRADNYRYCKEQWGLITKASACLFCPFHRNFFFYYLKMMEPASYEKLLAFDDRLGAEQPHTPIKSELFISRSRKRIRDLAPEECMDAEYFDYNGKSIWNGF